MYNGFMPWLFCGHADYSFILMSNVTNVYNSGINRFPLRKYKLSVEKTIIYDYLILLTSLAKQNQKSPKQLNSTKVSVYFLTARCYD